MPWPVGPNGETYRYRLAATALSTAITPGDSYDVAITIGPDQTGFWDTVQANGYDIALGYGDSAGIISYQRFFWDATVRGAVLRATVTLPASAPAGAVQVLYVYWGPTDGVAVTSDPSTGTPGGTVSASVVAPLIYPEGPTIRLDGGVWRQDGSSNTPTPAQTVVCGVGERRYGIADLGPDWRYPAGYDLNGHDQAGDVGWAHIVVTGSDASAPDWAISLGLRVYVDDVGTAVRVQIDVSHASDGLAVLYVGRSTGRIEKHYYRLRGIEPAI